MRPLSDPVWDRPQPVSNDEFLAPSAEVGLRLAPAYDLELTEWAKDMRHLDFIRLSLTWEVGFAWIDWRVRDDLDVNAVKRHLETVGRSRLRKQHKRLAVAALAHRWMPACPEYQAAAPVLAR